MKYGIKDTADVLLINKKNGQIVFESQVMITDIDIKHNKENNETRRR